MILVGYGSVYLLMKFGRVVAQTVIDVADDKFFKLLIEDVFVLASTVATLVLWTGNRCTLVSVVTAFTEGNRGNLAMPRPFGLLFIPSQQELCRCCKQDQILKTKTKITRPRVQYQDHCLQDQDQNQDHRK